MHFLKSLLDVAGKLITRVEGGIEVVMGTHQARQGGGSQAKGTQVVNGFAIGLGLAQGNDTLHGIADEVDLGLEVERWRITFPLDGGRVLGRIKTMLAGILITRWGTATTVRRGGGHIIIIERGFF
jgi:hypothetical protein